MKIVSYLYKKLFMLLHKKVEMRLEAERVIYREKALLIKAFCRQKGVQPQQLHRWRKKLVTLKEGLASNIKK